MPLTTDDDAHRSPRAGRCASLVSERSHRGCSLEPIRTTRRCAAGDSTCTSYRSANEWLAAGQLLTAGAPEIRFAASTHSHGFCCGQYQICAEARPAGRKTPPPQYGAALENAYAYQERVIKAVEAGDKEAATTRYVAAVPVIDTMVSKGIIHKNKAARHKSRLNTMVRALSLRPALSIV